MAKTVMEKYFDHPDLEILAMQPVLKHSPGNGRDQLPRYNVRYQTPFGEVGGNVDPLIFEDAQRLESEKVVLVSVRPRTEQPKGQFVKAGNWYQFDITGISAVPDDFGEKLSKPSKTKPLTSAFS